MLVEADGVPEAGPMGTEHLRRQVCLPTLGGRKYFVHDLSCSGKVFRNMIFRTEILAIAIGLFIPMLSSFLMSTGVLSLLTQGKLQPRLLLPTVLLRI